MEVGRILRALDVANKKGFAQGGNSEARLVGKKMAGQDVVLVNINYRLGVLGFLANEALYVT